MKLFVRVALSDSDEEVRITAITALRESGNAGNDSVVEALRQCVESKQLGVCCAASIALVTLEQVDVPRAKQLISTIVDHPDVWSYANEAVPALSAVAQICAGGAEHAAILLGELYEHASSGRYVLLDAVKEQPIRFAMPVLTRLLDNSRDDTGKEAITSAIQELLSW